MKQSDIWTKTRRVLAVLLAFVLLLNGKNRFGFFAMETDMENSEMPAEEIAVLDENTTALEQRTEIADLLQEETKGEPQEEQKLQGETKDELQEEQKLQEETDRQEIAGEEGPAEPDTQIPKENPAQAPVIRSINVSDPDSWTGSKLVTIEAVNASQTTEGLHYYYAASDVLAGITVFPEELPAGLAATGNQAQENSFAVTDAQDETGAAYYIYVVDADGNIGTGTAQVAKIDPIAPQITIKGGKKEHYFLNEGTVAVEFQVSSASGIERTKYRNSLGEWTDSGKPNEYGTVLVTFTQAGIYEFCVANGAGAETTETVSIKTDSREPVITIKSVVHDKGFTTQDENNTYYFSGSLNVVLMVTEDAETDPDGAASVITVTRKSENQEDDILQTIEPSGAVNTEILDTSIQESGTYEYTVSDEAGHSSSLTITAEKVTDSHFTAHASYQKAPKEVDANPVFTNPADIGFLLDISDEKGIAKIECKWDDEADYIEIFSAVTAGAAGEQCTPGNNQYKETYIPEKSFADGGSYSCTFRVTNAVGDVKEDKDDGLRFAFYIDASAPDTTAYIIYDTDTEEKTVRKEFSGGTTSEIFGKDTVEFYLLVKDAENGGYRSGIDTDALLKAIVAPEGFTVNGLSVLEDTGVQSDKIADAEGFTVLKGILEHKPDDSIQGKLKLKIEELKDRAGNTAVPEDEAVKELEADTVIFLDNCAPKLSISYGTAKRAGDVFFAKEAAELVFTVEEAFYAKNKDASGNPVSPAAVIQKSEDNGQTWTAVTEVPAWTWDETENKASAVFRFPAEAGKETTYRFSVAYQDKSGNFLEADDTAEEYIPQGSWEETTGTFSGYPVVIDQKLPEVAELVIQEDDKDLDEAEDSIITNSDEVIITGIVTDTHLASVELYKENGEAAGIEPKTGGDGKYTWSIRAEKYLKEKYYVAATDFAGNQNADPLVLSVEIDHIMPKILKISADSQEWADHHDHWSNTDTSFTITVLNDNHSSAIPKLRYRKDGSEEILEAEPGLKTEPEQNTDENEIWTFTVSETDPTFAGNYYFLTYDALGNGAGADGEEEIWRDFSFYKDKVHADVKEIYASYEDYTTDTSHENKISGLFAEFLGNFTDTELGEKLYRRLFVKTKIGVKLGIRDEISGVKSIHYTYAGKTGSAEVSEDIYKREDEDGNFTEYQVFYFTLTGEGSADTLTITSIEDIAGNIIECEARPEKLNGTTMLVIDQTAPTLTISYPDCTGVQPDPIRRHYRPLASETYEEVELTITEKYLDKQVDMKTGKVILPQIKVYKNDASEAMELSSLLKEGTKWEAGAWDSENGTIQAVLQLPYAEEAEEIEYHIEVTYQDGSKNMLKLDAKDPYGSIAEGTDTYVGGTLVLDTRAPELISCEIAEAPNRTMNDGTPVYTNKAGANDVTICFTVLDNEKYWNPDAWNISVWDVTHNKMIVNNPENLKWADQGDSHQGTLAFDGEKDVEANYHVVLSYEDYATNKMILNSAVTQGTLTEGVYTGSEFILDHVAPVVSIYYNEAYQVIDGENKTVKNQKIPLSGNYRSYYGKSQGNIQVTVALTENHLITDENQTNGIQDFSFRVNGAETAMDGSWEKSGTTYTRSYTMTKDGDYNIEVSYQDAAANAMKPSERVEGGKVTDQGSYRSSDLILDTTAPVLTRSYSAEPENTLPADGRIYYKDNVTLHINLVDQNIRYKELRDPMMKTEAVDLAGNEIKTNTANTAISAIEPFTVRSGARRGQWSIDIPLHTEANYTIPLSYLDLAGNKAELDCTERVTVDKTQPQFELNYSIKDPVNYKSHGYLFSRTKMTVTATASDETAGIRYITFIITDEDGKVTTDTKKFHPATGRKKYQITIPLKNADFKGTIQAEVYDWSANTAKQTRSHIVESNGKHSDTADAVIKTKTSPGRTVNGKDYYNTDVAFNLKISDSYSGIRSLSYTGGKTLSKSVNYAEEAGTDLEAGKPSQGITYVYSEDLTLDARQNNENEVKVHAEYEDNAGHTGKVEETYNIDITAPVIQVEYDLNDPSDERFYNQTRTATVTIRERNFDAKDVDFTITNTDGAMPAISGWTSSGTGDDTLNICKVTFGEDGDYTFTLDFMDLAGNKAVYDVVDEFTIDQTKPEMSVSYDNNAAKNGHYYDKSRTATIDILEHNFDPAHIEVSIAADRAGAPSLSGWSKNGDHNVATVTYSADADYTFGISGMDQALNPLADYPEDHFVVDQTPPELEIFDIENMSANNGIVRPGVRYSDTNYDANATVIKMKGYRNGEQQMDGTTDRTAEGVEIKLNDFAHTEEMDDLYTMEATVFDLAGNSSEASTVFSVNRFGSVYSYDETTGDLVGETGRYYTNEQQDIVVTETNVDTLEFKEITCNLNGTLRTMVEDEDYTVRVSGTDASWKQYTYVMDKKNFEEEGTYIISIYSEDRANNSSDNSTKGKKIEFVMDTTKPSVLISGVENDGQYRENSREITLDVQDNIRLADVEIMVDGTPTFYTAEQLTEADGKITYTAGSANDWQEMTVTAQDAAGNQYASDKMRFLVTANVLVQFYRNKPLFYGFLAAIAILGAGVCLIFAKRKKKQEKVKVKEQE